MAILKIDQLNQVQKKRKAIPIEQFFREMELSEEEQNKRIEIANMLMNIIMLAILMIDAEVKLGRKPDRDYYINYITVSINDVLSEFGIINNELQDYLRDTAKDTVDNTINEKQLMESQDRSIAISEDLTNQFSNANAYEKAKLSGKKYKIWRTKNDSRVRKTHVLVNDERLPIDTPFRVGRSYMQYCCDRSMGAEDKEIINCRCICEYE